MERYRILESEVDFDLIGNKFRPDYTQLIYFYRNYGELWLIIHWLWAWREIDHLLFEVYDMKVKRPYTGKDKRGERCLVLNTQSPQEVLAYVNNIPRRKDLIYDEMSYIWRKKRENRWTTGVDSGRYNDVVCCYLTWCYANAEKRLRKFHVCDPTMQKHLQFRNDEGSYDATFAVFSHRWACEADYTALLRWTMTDDHYEEQGRPSDDEDNADDDEEEEEEA